MHTPDLKNKRVIVVGLGLTGQSCVRFLQEQGADVAAMDSRKDLTVNLDIPVHLGEFDPASLLRADMILLSPGVNPMAPAIRQAREKGVETIGDVELFARCNRRPVIGITGSNGKSTVTCLVTNMLMAAGYKTCMGGNIGTPVLDLLDQSADILVLELSSFQLESTRSLTPLVATLLNLSDDHLDRHGSRQAYHQAKQAIYHNARFCVANRDDKATWPSATIADQTFGLSMSDQGFAWHADSGQILLDGKAFLSADQSLLVGQHNMLNIQAAAACALLAGADLQAVTSAASRFGGLPHRCETISRANDVCWINDSKATNVGATLAAISGLKKTGKLILIAGGQGKGADFACLDDVLNNQVDTLITLGKNGRDIAARKAGAIQVQDMSAAVYQAHSLAEPGDTVLLSPACASLDMFANYQQRGDCFVQTVRRVTAC